MSHLPFMQFYPADWIQDTQTLTLEAQGAWIKLICAMWVAPERGRITFTKRHLNVFLANSTSDATHQIVADLDTVADIEWRDIDGNTAETWEDAYEIHFNCRRMIREEAKRKQGLEADRRYRDNKTSEKRPSNVSKTSKIYQKSEVRSHISEEEDKNKREAPKPIELPDWLHAGAWESFIEHRKRIKKPLGPRAASLAINELAKLRVSGHDPDKVIDQSVLNGWAGLFPIKPQLTSINGRAETPADRLSARIQRLTGGTGL